MIIFNDYYHHISYITITYLFSNQLPSLGFVASRLVTPPWSPTQRPGWCRNPWAAALPDGWTSARRSETERDTPGGQCQKGWYVQYITYNIIHYIYIWLHMHIYIYVIIYQYKYIYMSCVRHMQTNNCSFALLTLWLHAQYCQRTWATSTSAQLPDNVGIFLQTLFYDHMEVS